MQHDEKKKAVQLASDLIEANAVVIDTETTSLDGVAIQIALVSLRDGSVIYKSYVHTDQEIDPRAHDVHGISLDDLKDAPSAEKVGAELDALLDGKILVAYNANFDAVICNNTFPNSDFLNNDWVCAMYDIAVPLTGSTNQYGSISLANALRRLGLKWRGNAHDAAGDCLATADLISAVAQTNI